MRQFRRVEFDGLECFEGAMATDCAPMKFVSAIIAGLAIGGAALGAHAAGNAANTQATAATQAGNLQYQASQQALAEQQRQFNITQGNIAPWLQTGQASLAQLAHLMGITLPPAAGGAPGGTGGVAGAGGVRPGVGRPELPGQLPIGERPGGPRLIEDGTAPGGGVDDLIDDAPPQDPGADVPPGAATPLQGGFGSLMQTYGREFEAPDPNDILNDPAYKFRLSEGMKALEGSAASRGKLLTGGTLKDLQDYGSGAASQEYANIYDRRLGEFRQGYNIFNQDQNTQFNRLSALSGGGQVAANQLADLGARYADSSGRIIMGGADARANALNNAAAARASGYVGGANAWGGALSDLARLLGRYRER